MLQPVSLIRSKLNLHDENNMQNVCKISPQYIELCIVPAYEKNRRFSIVIQF